MFWGGSTNNQRKEYVPSQTYLVGGLEHEFHFSHHIGNVIIPTDFHSIIFQKGRYTTNQP